MFWKNKDVNLTAYTYSESYIKTCPPIYKPTEKPSWLKKLKTFTVDWDQRSQMAIKNATAAVCPAVRYFLSEPITLSLWADIDIKIFPDGKWTHYTRPEWNVMLGEHHGSQFGEAYNGRVAIKLTSPWYFKTDDPAKFMFMESHYSTSFFRDHNIILPPGLIEYKYQHATNVHMLFPIKDEEYVVRLKHGTPLISMFPMFERKLNFETKLIPYNEFAEFNTHMPQMFIGRYFKQLKDKS